MRLLNLLAAVALALAGAAAGLLATAARRAAPRPDELSLSTTPFRMERPSGEPLLVTEAKWLELPMLRGDYDLLAQLEIGEGAELDLVARRIESRPLQGTSLGMHSRLAVLRMSATTAGEPWRNTTEALFGEPGGVKLLSGVAATVTIEARGRVLRANVAGRKLDDYLAQDDHGSLALIARGGTAAVHSLQLTPIDARSWPHPALAGFGFAVLLAGLGVARRARPKALLAAAVVLVAAAEIGRRIAFADLPPLAQPDLGDEWRVALAGVPLALAVLSRGRAALGFGLAGVAVASWLVVSVIADLALRFPPTPELDAWLGPQSRETATELLARRLRGPTSIYTAEPAKHRAMLLGGQLLYRRGAAPDQHVEPMLTGELRGVARDAEVVTVPTEDGFSSQQWGLFDRFLRPFAPQALVFGIPRDEAVEDGSGKPRSTPAALSEAIAAARVWAAETGGLLVLLLDEGVPAEFAKVARTAHDQGVALVEITPNDAASGIARKLAEVIGPHWR